MKITRETLDGIVTQWERVVRALVLRNTIRDTKSRAMLMWEYSLTDNGLRELVQRRPK